MSVTVGIDSGKCQGHGRCYDLAAEVFGADEEGYAVLVGDGTVPPELQQRATVAAANCPENAIAVSREG